jgi:acyl-CoA synthetase (AMP-forming)/AMP-acid ligase II
VASGGHLPRRDVHAPPSTLEEVVERMRAGDIRSLPAPPFMHGAAHWVAFNMWAVGGTVIVQSQPRRLDPHDIWSTVERERVTVLTIVGDAFGRPLVDQLRVRDYDLSSLRMLSSGGAILTAALKQEFLERLPGLRLLDALGSSESGAQASQVSQAGVKRHHRRFRDVARQHRAQGGSLRARGARLRRDRLAGAQRDRAARLPG